MNTEDVIRRLEQMREASLNRQSRLEKKVVHREEALSADFSEQAVELQNQETMEQLMVQVQAELRAIQAAFNRISDGVYDECSRCNASIESDRLIALPTTTLCASCAQAE